jgi:hypothetical protein
MDYLKEIQRRVKEIELSRWGDYFLNDALVKKPIERVRLIGFFVFQNNVSLKQILVLKI